MLRTLITFASAGAEHGGGHGGGFLALDPGLVFWTAVTFLLVLGILSKFAWKPIIEKLDEREKRIRDALAEGERAREEAKRLLDEYETRLAGAREESAAIMEEAKRDAAAVKDKLIADAKGEAAAISARSLKEIEMAKTKALDELRAGTADLSVRIAAKVLGRSVNADDHRRLIDETIRDYEKSSAAELN